MIENMKITSTMLGYEDHSILTCWLQLEGDGCGVGFGGYALDTYDKAKEKRVALGIGFDAIIEILNTLGLRSWEELPGTFVRAETEGIGGRCKRIGHLMKDRWFSFEEYFAPLRANKE